MSWGRPPASKRAAAVWCTWRSASRPRRRRRPRAMRPRRRSTAATSAIPRRSASRRYARIARHYADSYGVTVEPERIAVTTGSSAGFILAFLALFEPGDRVALASPGYPPYRHILTALGCEPVLIPISAETRWSVTVGARWDPGAPPIRGENTRVGRGGCVAEKTSPQPAERRAGCDPRQSHGH